jgi:hypothetical protein
LVVAVAGLFVPAIAVAQKSAGGVVGGARLHPGTWGNQRTSRSVMRSRPTYRSAGPLIVWSTPAPKAIAPAPTGIRRFSYEPPKKVDVAREDNARSAATTATNERPTQVCRSFSYDPWITSYSVPNMRTDSAPKMRSSRTARYLLPKTDPNKYRVL